MPCATTDTHFASPERDSEEELRKQVNNFSGKNLYTYLLDSTPNHLIVLNKNRQIVFANKSARNLFDGISLSGIYGMRTGELLNCEHAFNNSGGCGTSEFCRTCGAIRAILSSLNGVEDVQECRVIKRHNHEALDLRVWTKPLEFKDKQYSVFTFVDISHEKRRIALERIFFHDVLNTAGIIKSYINVLQEVPNEDIKDYKELGAKLADRLVEEIKAQRDLTLAENRELEIKLQLCSPNKLLSDLVNLYKHHIEASGVEIILVPEESDINFTSDGVLISRVLGNMIKNALESSEKGDKVFLGYEITDGRIKFYVNNKGFIPEDIQLQIFSRSFSTKGNDRGLGTYGMKLLSEQYLKGNVYFESDKKNGTTFYAEYPVTFN